MFEEADNIVDIFRGGLPYCLLIALPILIICSSKPVLASSEFTVYRMSQYDVNGISYGCRTSVLSLEAKSLGTWNSNRHCVIAKLQNLSVDAFNDIRQKAGALVIILPQKVNLLSVEEKKHLNALEQAFLAQSISIPVYFAPHDHELERIVVEITNADNEQQDNLSKRPKDSAFVDLISSIAGNGYHITVSGRSNTANKNSKIPLIQGDIAPNQYVVKKVENGIDSGSNINLPIIVIVAHLRTFGVYNTYPLNSDVAVFFSLVELFSKLHSIPGAVPKYRIIFVLSESGLLLNYQGVKKWLDENVSLQHVEFVLCLDNIVQAFTITSENALYMHVSKPPKEGSSISNFLKNLKTISNDLNQNITIEGVHKKINLADTQLAWEHERFSMKRFPAFTLSAVKSPKHPIRYTIFKDDDGILLSKIQTQTNLIAEALAKYIYNIDSCDSIFKNTTKIEENLIKTYMNVRSLLHNNDVKEIYEKLLKNVRIMYEKPDVREPDFMFYNGHDAKLNVYNVKPAIFDLFLTILICLYLTSVYFVVRNFTNFYSIICKFTRPQSTLQYSCNTERNRFKVNLS